MEGNILTKLSQLEGLINQLPLTQDSKDRFADYVEMCRTNLGVAHFSTTGRQLDAILVELAWLLEDQGELLEEIVAKVDEIKGQELFFNVPASELIFLPSETYYMGSMDCSVRIFVRGLGPVMFDPGGVLYSKFANSVELIALGGEPGGSFDWEWDPGNNVDFLHQGDRAYFRIGEYETTSIRVTHTSLFQNRCQAVLRVIMQDGFPTGDDF